MASLCKACGGDGGQRARGGLPGEAQLGRWAVASRAKAKRLDILLLALGRL